MDFEKLKTIALAATIAVAVIGVLFAVIIKKILGKIISLLLAAVLVFFVWQQRNHIVSYAQDVRNGACSVQQTFFFIPVKLPADWCAGPAAKD